MRCASQLPDLSSLLFASRADARQITFYVWTGQQLELTSETTRQTEMRPRTVTGILHTSYTYFPEIHKSPNSCCSYANDQTCVCFVDVILKLKLGSICRTRGQIETQAAADATNATDATRSDICTRVHRELTSL